MNASWEEGFIRMKQYDVIIIWAGPGGIYSAWEMAMKKPELKIAVFEKGRELEKRKCPINGDTVKNCVDALPVPL